LALPSRAGSKDGDWQDWRWQYARRLRRPEELARFQGGDGERQEEWRRVGARYPFAVTPYYLSLLDPTDENDPLRRQCWPDIRELGDAGGCGQEDPLEEDRHMPVPGLIRRYPDRCLVLATNRCAVFCRHCNRKRFWRQSPRRFSRSYFRRIIDRIAREPDLREVIVSGGDALMMSDEALDWLLSSLRDIPHVEVVRIGSRAPAVLPMRVSPELVAVLKRHRPLWFNTQFNHPREITAEAARACELLLSAGIPVSNQAVLLRGINDDEDTLRELFYGLQRISVRPYYLFSCDPVRGTGHFQVDTGWGTLTMDRLRRRTSGLCLPRYVLDSPVKGVRSPWTLPRRGIMQEANSFDKKGKIN